MGLSVTNLLEEKLGKVKIKCENREEVYTKQSC